ncbi:MAG: ATP-binding protein [Limnobacter sp.]|nr:ATP-binding protein [Limnobacter sp.]
MRHDQKNPTVEFTRCAIRHLWIFHGVVVLIFLSENLFNLIYFHKSTEFLSVDLLFSILLLTCLYHFSHRWKALLKQIPTSTQQVEVEEVNESVYLTRIGFIAHELRNAVNSSVMAWEATVQNGSSFASPMVARAKATSTDLQDLLNNLLDSSALLEGKLTPRIEKYSVENLVTELLDSFAIGCERKNVALILHYQPGIPEYLELDAFRVKQVLSNLLSNALKFTQQGSVVFSVTFHLIQADQLELTFCVKDSGPGIPEAELAKLFAAFKQTGSHELQRFGGSGLGLFICKQLVELLGGRISLKNRMDALGAEAHVVIPARMAQAASSPIKKLNQALDQKRLIVVSHSREEREGIRFNLSNHYKHISDYATLGECLEDLRSVRQEYRLPTSGDTNPGQLDVLMAVEVIQHERNLIEGLRNAMRWFKGRLNIVLLAPYLDQTGQVERLKALGFERSLVRPSFPKTIIKEFSPEQPGNPFAESVDGVVDMSGFNILLVEDIAVLQELTRDVLQGFGAKVHTAVNGAEAIASIKSSNTKFDVILMDVQMPVMDGLEASREIRKKFTQEELPIVATTSCQFDFEIQRCKDAGMNLHLSKPLSFSRVKEVLLGLKAKQVIERPSEFRSYGQELHCIETGLKNFGGRTALYFKACTLFITEVGSCLHDLKNSFDDRSKIASTAHRLVGMSAFVGLNRLASEASRIEKMSLEYELGSYLTGEIMGLCDLIELSIGVLFDAKSNAVDQSLQFS